MSLQENLLQLRVLFQPVCLTDGHLIYGYEGCISDSIGTRATTLYEVAAKDNSVQLLEKIAFTKICREFMRQSVGGKLFINVFCDSLVNGSLSPEKILLILYRNKIEPTHIVIELQEFAPSRNINQLVTAVNTLKAEGIQIALDGYGFGYSNLGRLLELSPHYIKIDARYFIDPDDERKIAVFVSLLQMCTFLEICVIAKNVETSDIAHTIRTKVAVQLLQGDYFGRPKTEDERVDDVRRTSVRYQELLTPFLSSYFAEGMPS